MSGTSVLVVTVVCSRCSEQFERPQQPGMPKRYCSDTCRRAVAAVRRRENRHETNRKNREATKQRLAAIVRVCPMCQGEFTPKQRSAQVFCSRVCSQRQHRDRFAECTVADCDKPERAKGLCNGHYKAQHPNRSAWSKGTDEARRIRDRKRTQRRRALVNDPAAEVIDRDEIGDRDGWICQLCEDPIDRQLEYPDPMSPSLDHAQPLSLGGLHVEANVQIAHLDCNIRKGNRVAASAA